jgi:NAD(P) transhydrogenase subunit beta
MSDLFYYLITAGLSLLVLAGIALMSKVRTASAGNMLSALSMLLAIMLTLYKYDILTDIFLWAAMAAGSVISVIFAYRVKMIQMPQAMG